MGIRCDICGGAITKKNNVFICSDCGCEYSIDELRRQLNTGDGKMPTPTDNGQNNERTDVYFDLANKEVKVENYEKAIEYYEKILEIEPSNSKAWLEKGTSLIALKGFDNDEVNAALCNAYEFSGHNAGIKAGIIDGLKSVEEYFVALLSMYVDNMNNEEVVNVITESYTKKIIKINSINDYFSNRVGFIVYDERFITSLIKQNTDVMKKVINVIEESPYSDDEEKYDAVRRIITFTSIALSHAFVLAHRFAVDEEKKQYLNEKINILDESMYIVKYVLYNGHYINRWRDEMMTTIYAQIEEIRSHFVKYQNQQREENQKRAADAYWKKHPDEKEKLDNELEIIKGKIEEVEPIVEEKEKELSMLGRIFGLDSINEEIDQKQSLYNSLGVFKGKEKKALMDEIEILKKQKDELDRKVMVNRNELKKILNQKRKELSGLKNEYDCITQRIKNPIQA